MKQITQIQDNKTPKVQTTLADRPQFGPRGLVEPATPAQAQHSPLPWRSQFATVRQCNSPVIITDCYVNGETSDEAIANAAFIVRACNNAQRLVDALKRIAYEPQGATTASHADVLRAVENIAREALAEWSKQK